MTKVLLVEDHASFREALATVMDIEDDLEAVGEVERADEAAPAAERLRPDVALVDLDLPGGGILALDELRRRCPATACIVLSALSDDMVLGQAIEAGASAVLHKSVAIPELLRVIRVVAGGQTVLPAEPTSRALRALAAHRDRDWHARILAETITQREHEVLQHLAEGGDNLSIGRRLGISPQTVQTHIRNILAKLAVGSRLEAVAKALRYGLIDPPR